MKSFLCIILALLCVSAQGGSNPIVQLPYGKVVGYTSSGNPVERFLGVPYTDGPTKRFTLGVLPTTQRGTINATQPAFSCPNLWLGPPDGAQADETRCLNLDITRPVNTKPDAKLPVAVWFYGGSFTDGSSGGYDATNLVSLSVQINVPVIWVAINYRMHAFGFLSGSELQSRGLLNLGLKDQRLAVHWVKQFIGAFGGDGTKVTLVGQSAGAIGVGHQLLAYGNKKDTGLFRGVILESGGPTSEWVPTWKAQQGVWDYMINNTNNCQKAKDKFTCLQSAGFDDFSSSAQDASSKYMPSYMNMPFTPVVDGDFIQARPSLVLQAGNYSKIPILCGNVMDEGAGGDPASHTKHAYDTDKQVQATMVDWTHLDSNSIAKWLSYYPNVPALGSPYNTGNYTYYSAQFKRMAAIDGDLEMTQARRYIARTVSTPVWSYLFNYVDNPNDAKKSDYTGVAHASDIGYWFQWFNQNDITKQMTKYWLSFITFGDPNAVPGSPQWPNYNAQTKIQIQFNKTAISTIVDNYREDSIGFIWSNYAQLNR